MDGYFTYGIPDTLSERVAVGMRVLCPLGKSKKYIGIVANITGTKPDFEVKDIIDVLDGAPVVPDKQLRLWQWLAEYYLSPIGDVYKSALPSGLKAEEGWHPRTELFIGLAKQFCTDQGRQIAAGMLRRAVKQLETLNTFFELATVNGDRGVTKEELMNQSNATAATIKGLVDKGILYTYKKEVGRLNDGGADHPERIKALSTAQSKAFDAVVSQFHDHNVVLLHGVTSSGKTELYIHLIAKAIADHKQVLYLLPEIALTVQIMQRLQNIFGGRLGIYHSKYSDAERVEIWRKQLSDHPYDVILGARSAVFLPFRNLGLVIVDEEHETSFKQQDPAPRYHARDTAIVMAHQLGAKVLLGTATPAIETYHNALSGKYGLVRMAHRYGGVQLPEIVVEDVKELRRKRLMKSPFSPRLATEVRKAIEGGGQAILFQNRRGYAPVLECKACGWTPRCTRCDVSLTYHQRLGKLVCHYCGAQYSVPTQCPACGGTEMRDMGYGTEKIEDEAAKAFPDARMERMDLDTTRSRTAYERIIHRFASGDTNLLIGTQMVTKGLDFDRVQVVGVLNADQMLGQPDFRAYERAYQMMSQVAGRAGRRGRRGLVVVQTKQADNPIIDYVRRSDYEAMYRQQLAERQAFGYPPFSRIISIYLKHRNDAVVDHAAHHLAALLRPHFADGMLGPDRPVVARVQMQYIRKIMLKVPLQFTPTSVRRTLLAARDVVHGFDVYKSVTIYFDVE